jgi:hypothetical protein
VEKNVGRSSLQGLKEESREIVKAAELGLRENNYSPGKN